MMKKWIALLLAMTTLLPIAVSCGKGGEEPADTTTAATTVATEATVTTEATVETNK